jgi:hypothetical protein
MRKISCLEKPMRAVECREGFGGESSYAAAFARALLDPDLTGLDQVICRVDGREVREGLRESSPSCSSAGPSSSEKSPTWFA